MTIAMVASEANPLCKTGGLADVIGSLSRELCLMGEDCFVVLPFYKCIKDSPFFRVKREGSFNVFMAWRCQNAEVFSLVSNGVTYYLIGNDYYFNRESLYGFDDDGERFAFFTLAAWQLFECIDKKPDIIHVHDWQTGMLPVLIRERSMQDPRLKDAKLVLTLHNEAFKGYLDQYFLNHFYGLNDEIFNDGRVRFDVRCGKADRAPKLLSGHHPAGEGFHRDQPPFLVEEFAAPRPDSCRRGFNAGARGGNDV